MRLHVGIRGDGPALVLLHGWGMHSGAWDEALGALEARWRVHAIDLPGHGMSRGVASAGFDEAVARVAEALPPDAVLCGWSLGGLFAQRLAAGPAHGLRGLALVGTTPRFVATEGWPHAMAPATLQAFADGLRTDRAATLQAFVRLNALHGSHAREAIRALSMRLVSRGEMEEAALARSLGWLRDTDLRDGAARIALPTCVIHGARDALAPIAAGRWLAATIPGARLVEFEDAAHIPFFTHRDAFAAALEHLRG